MAAMLAEYMESGFLDNIIDMFRAEPGLFEHLPGLIADERGRVRLGTAALVETLRADFGSDMEAQLDGVSAALSNPNPTIRADAAYLLELVGGPKAKGLLDEALAREGNQTVRAVLSDALDAWAM